MLHSCQRRDGTAFVTDIILCKNGAAHHDGGFRKFYPQDLHLMLIYGSEREHLL